MTMRAPASDLPILFAEAGILAGKVAILDDISLSIGPGTPTVLIGPNGAGKTTLLRAAVGLIQVSRGRVTWAGREVSPPTRRAILLQRPVMLRRSAAGNVSYALRTAGVPQDEHEQRISDLLALVGLEGLQRRPGAAAFRR
jgi:tungstate transport system ATP-binding protein